MKITDEMVQRAIKRYFERSGWTMLGANMRSVLEAALADLPEPGEWMAELRARNARIRELEGDLEEQKRKVQHWLSHDCAAANQRIAELETQLHKAVMDVASCDVQIEFAQQRIAELETQRSTEEP